MNKPLSQAMFQYNYETMLAYGQSFTGTDLNKKLFDIQNGGFSSDNKNPCTDWLYMPKSIDMPSINVMGVRTTTNYFPQNEYKFGYVSRTYGKMPGIPEKEQLKGRNNHMPSVLYNVAM